MASTGGKKTTCSPQLQTRDFAASGCPQDDEAAAGVYLL